MAEDKQEKGSPMDPSAKEGANPGHAVRTVRRAYALDTLVEEVEQAFGEVVVTYGEPDNWQVIHDVTFHIPDEEDTPFPWVIEQAVEDDPRVWAHMRDEAEDLLLVEFVPNRRIRDSRDGFGVKAVLDVYQEDSP